VRAAWLLVIVLAGCKEADGISRDLGAACSSQLDCTDRCLPSPRWPNGFCSLACDTADDCPVGADCAPTAEGRVCLFRCFDDRDCDFLEAGAGASGWACRTLGGVDVCAPPSVTAAPTEGP
jgi:hypothetical protein